MHLLKLHREDWFGYKIYTVKPVQSVEESKWEEKKQNQNKTKKETSLYFSSAVIREEYCS